MVEFHSGGSASNRASLFSFLVVAGIYLSGIFMATGIERRYDKISDLGLWNVSLSGGLILKPQPSPEQDRLIRKIPPKCDRECRC